MVTGAAPAPPLLRTLLLNLDCISYPKWQQALLLARTHHVDILIIIETHLPPDTVPPYVVTDTHSHLTCNGPAQGGSGPLLRSAYRGGILIASLNHNISLARLPLPAGAPLPDNGCNRCLLVHYTVTPDVLARAKAMLTY